MMRRRPPSWRGEPHRIGPPRGLPGSAIVWIVPRNRKVVPAQWRARHAPVEAICPRAQGRLRHAPVSGFPPCSDAVSVAATATATATGTVTVADTATGTGIRLRPMGYAVTYPASPKRARQDMKNATGFPVAFVFD